jgi:septum formation protein
MIILASQSPRRAELLRQVGITFDVRPADIDESVQPDEGPGDYVERVAIAKASSVHRSDPRYPVLGADTAVVIDQTILGKPRDRDEAVAMLQHLSGRTHEVLSGIAVVGDAGATHYRLNVSRVMFRPISESEAHAYWATGEPVDKAGGYAIQGLGAAFVERIEGSYSAIMGLPLFETLQLLSAVGVSTRLAV